MASDEKAFIHKVSDSQAQLASKMAEDIKKAIYKYEKQVPLALALGVLRIVENEILENCP